jgi:hypothetical protein
VVNFAAVVEVPQICLLFLARTMKLLVYRQIDFKWEKRIPLELVQNIIGTSTRDRSATIHARD